MILDFTAKKIADTIDSFNNPNKALFIYGHTGKGKTYSALKYCAENKNCLYFSFRNLDSEFALKVFSNSYPKIFAPASDWSDFFKQLACYSKKNRLTVFFDHIGDRNDKDEFNSALSAFLGTSGNAKIILIGKKLTRQEWEKIGVPYTYTTPKHISTQELADILSISNELSVKLYCITDGIPSLLEEYNTELTFEDNLKMFLNVNSKYYQLAVNWMKESFRTPETYNTLLFGMANGYNRISELAKFSGYPKNKCDKYIKALAEHHLVQKQECENGHSRYYPNGNYLTLWYRFLLTATPNADGSFSDELSGRFTEYLNKIILADFHKDMCDFWVRSELNHFSHSYVDTENPNYHDVKLDDITFGFACESYGTNFYIYYNNVPNDKLTSELWSKIEKVTTKSSPFYKNEYFICTVNSVPKSYWELSKQYDNVHIIQLKSLFSKFNREYNKRVHPRFVPSFVRYR